MRSAPTLAFLFPISLMAFSKGPPIMRTGGVDGGVTCAACHSTFGAANSDSRGSVRIEGLTPYVPGTPQNLRIIVRHPDALRWGFQLTARFVTGGGTVKAGSFAPIDAETKVVCDDGPNDRRDPVLNERIGSDGPCTAEQHEWIEHADAPRDQAGFHTFAVQWTPPPDEFGDIVLYVAGNAADGNNLNTNDRIYTTSLRIPLSTDASCPLTRRPQVRNAVNAGAHAGPFSSNSMVEIYGSDFQAGSRSRIIGAGDLGSGRFPRELSCIAVEIGGQRAPVTYVQQDQINVQAPTTTVTGPVTLVVIANPGRPNELRGDPATVTMTPIAPSFFTLGATRSIAAHFAGTANVVADPAVVPGARPARPGEIVTLYGTGFGATNPAFGAGEIPEAAANLVITPTVTIGGIAVAAPNVLYAGLSPGSISALYQFNVRIPESAPTGDLPVVISLAGASTQAGATIPVRRE